MAHKVRYEEMLPHEIVAAREACPVAYVPLGGVEWHGEHNCVGLDTVKIHALAMKCAEAHGGLVMPALFFGEPRESHLMEANSGHAKAIAGKMGLPFENFAPGYMHALRLEEHERYVRLLVHILFQMQSLGFRAVVLMAGHYPLLRHDLVDLGRLPEGEGPDVLIGVGGRDPREFASVEYGQQGVEAVVRRVGEKVKEMLA
jgi:creatinine amidohydrolase